MRKFEYVTKNEFMPVKKELMELINLVQDEVRKYFTFRFDFIGSASRNMITREVDGNVGYDFDVNIQVNDDNENYDAGQIRNILKNAFDKYNKKFNYDFTEDSKRVLTIKVKDRKNKKILHSCDFAIVYNCGDGRQQYIHFNKNQNTYEWQYQPKGFYQLPERIDAIKKNGLWQDVKELYLEKKCCNEDKNKKSRSIFAETINEIFNQNF